jgi:hypothetical protein
MKAEVRTLRILIILAFALALIGPLSDLFFPELVPKLLLDARDSYEQSQEWSLIEISVMLISALGGLLLAAVSTIGLFMLKPWGRKVTLWLTVAAPFSYPLLGPTLESGWATACSIASSTIWGVVLAMTYFSDLTTHFDVSK